MSLVDVKKGFAFAQRLEQKTVYTVKDDAIPIAGSQRTAYRRLNSLAAYGLANFKSGKFEIHRATRQPYHIFEKLLPSLSALKQGRRFGRFYNDYDVNFLIKHLPEHSMITLDYKAWELTKFQTPSDLYMYVDDLELFSSFLKENKFREGRNGHIVILPKIGSFNNPIERVYLDCIANGGRSTFDAIAIELLHGEKLNVKGDFPIDYVLKVQEDMPKDVLNENQTVS